MKFKAAGCGFASKRHPSPFSFLQVVLPILWTREPGQMRTVSWKHGRMR